MLLFIELMAQSATLAYYTLAENSNKHSKLLRMLFFMASLLPVQNMNIYNITYIPEKTNYFIDLTIIYISLCPQFPQKHASLSSPLLKPALQKKLSFLLSQHLTCQHDIHPKIPESLPL